jgi:hypothetical protein
VLLVRWWSQNTLYELALTDSLGLKRDATADEEPAAAAGDAADAE